MKVGIDITGLFRGYRTGVQNYYYGLMEGLNELDLKRERVEIVFLDRTVDEVHPLPIEMQRYTFRRVVPWPYLPSLESLTATPVLRPMANFYTRHLTWQRRKAAQRRHSEATIDVDLDVLHVWHMGIKSGPTRNVVMVYDLIPLNFPQWFGDAFIAETEQMISFAREKADIVMTISEFTRQELLRIGFAAHKVVTTPLGVGAAFNPCSDQKAMSEIRQRYGLGDAPFVLSVGYLDPRKNLEALIKAFEQALECHTGPLNLVIVGPRSSATQEVMTLLEQSKRRDRIILTGYVSLKDLPVLYSMASVFAFLSLYEGFGLPVLEAMACGTPVIASNTTALPEVCGDAAVLVDPRDITSAAEAIVKLMGYKEYRDEVRRQGIIRAKQFTWKACAERHLMAYRKASL
jgi:glycosyltransferase involved in cell wall biosynthesis